MSGALLKKAVFQGENKSAMCQAGHGDAFLKNNGDSEWHITLLVFKGIFERGDAADCSTVTLIIICESVKLMGHVFKLAD